MDLLELTRRKFWVMQRMVEDAKRDAALEAIRAEVEDLSLRQATLRDLEQDLRARRFARQDELQLVEREKLLAFYQRSVKGTAPRPTDAELAEWTAAGLIDDDLARQIAAQDRRPPEV